MKKILENFKQLVRLQNKKLSETTYILLVEYFVSNAYFDHASFMLCQMDKNKVKIPRNLLDLFLDYSIQNKIFENPEKFKNKNSAENNFDSKKNFNSNKFDEYEGKGDADYAYYFSKKNNSRQRNISGLISNLKINSTPFYPKSIEGKNLLKDIDPSKVKAFIPKGFIIAKKDEEKTN